MQMDMFLSEEEVEVTFTVTPLDQWKKIEMWVRAHKDDPKKFSPMDLLAVEYKCPTTTDRRRGKIYQEFVERFANLVKQKVGAFVKNTRSSTKNDYFDEGMAIWTRMVGEKLNQWDAHGKKHAYLNILAYLYPFANRGVASELQEKHAFKDMRYATTDATEGTTDALNGLAVNSDAWRAYEASLMSVAFDTDIMIGSGDLLSVLDSVDLDSAVKEIDGYYDGRNHTQWDQMADTHKHVGENTMVNVGKTSIGNYNE